MRKLRARGGSRASLLAAVARGIASSCVSRPSVRLVIEVDGGYHAGRAKADALRDRRLGALGYRVVRLPAEIVAHDIEQAIAIMVAALRWR